MRRPPPERAIRSLGRGHRAHIIPIELASCQVAGPTAWPSSSSDRQAAAAILIKWRLKPTVVESRKPQETAAKITRVLAAARIELPARRATEL
jgi:hypothetical protein